jgi:plastocyanin
MPFLRRSGRAARTEFLVFISALFVILMIGVFAAGCGGASGTTTTAGGTVTTAGPSTTAGSAGGVQVAMKNIAFDPTSITIKAGESVTWTNDDGVTHTVTADNGEFDSGDVAPGATFSFTFAKAGTYPYHCTIHPGMKGTVLVQ